MNKFIITASLVFANNNSTESILTKEYYKKNVEVMEGLNPFLKKAHEWVNKGDVEY